MPEDDSWVDDVLQRFQQPTYEEQWSRESSRDANEFHFRHTTPDAYRFSPMPMMNVYQAAIQAASVSNCISNCIPNLLSSHNSNQYPLLSQFRTQVPLPFPAMPLSPQVTELPAQHASDAADATVMVFNLQSDVRVTAHKLGIPSEDLIPDSSMELFQRKRILEHSLELLRTMQAEKKDSSGMNRIPSSDQSPKQGDAKDPRIAIASTRKPRNTLPELQFRKLIETDKFIDIPAECLAKCKVPDLNLAAEIQSGRADYSPQYFISWSGNYIAHCARGLPLTKGCMGKKFLIDQFALHHGKAGKTSRVLGPYRDCVIDYDQLIQAAKTTWPDVLTDAVIKQLENCRSASMRQKRHGEGEGGSNSNPLRGGGDGAGATPPGGRGDGSSSGDGDSGGEGGNDNGERNGAVFLCMFK